MIKTRGIYVTKPQERVNYAGGNAIKSFSHRGYWFLENGEAILAVVKNRELNTRDFKKKNTIAHYEQVDAETIKMDFYRGTKYNFQALYKLKTSDILINDKGLEYHFVPVDEAELQAAIEELDQKTSESDDWLKYRSTDDQMGGH